MLNIVSSKANNNQLFFNNYMQFETKVMSSQYAVINRYLLVFNLQHA